MAVIGNMSFAELLMLNAGLQYFDIRDNVNTSGLFDNRDLKLLNLVMK